VVDFAKEQESRALPTKTSTRGSQALAKQILTTDPRRHEFKSSVFPSPVIRLLVWRLPNRVGWGNAWRLAIPPEFHATVSNCIDCLEFLTYNIAVWQAIKNGNSKSKECFLSLGDSMSAVGWLHQANTDDLGNLPLFIASRKFVRNLLSSHSSLYSQHIPGVSDSIADALSQEFDLSDEYLTDFIHSTYLHQVLISFVFTQSIKSFTPG